MALRSGERFEIPHEGETWLVLSTAEEGGFEIELTLARGAGPPMHCHDHEAEEMEVLSGRLGCVLDGQRSELGAGERLVIPAGCPHRIWGASDEPVRLRTRYGGAEFQALVAELAPGDRRGFLRMARLSVPSGWAGSRPTQAPVRGLLRALAAVGGLMGVRARAEEAA